MKHIIRFCQTLVAVSFLIWIAYSRKSPSSDLTLLLVICAAILWWAFYHLGKGLTEEGGDACFADKTVVVVLDEDTQIRGKIDREPDEFRGDYVVVKDAEVVNGSFNGSGVGTVYDHIAIPSCRLDYIRTEDMDKV